MVGTFRLDSFAFITSVVREASSFNDEIAASLAFAKFVKVIPSSKVALEEASFPFVINEASFPKFVLVSIIVNLFLALVVVELSSSDSI